MSRHGDWSAKCRENTTGSAPYYQEAQRLIKKHMEQKTINAHRYEELRPDQRRALRNLYVKHQNGKCFYCLGLLSEVPPKKVTDKKIKWELFPDNFLDYPVHLQHDHNTGLTEGAVHAYCNAVMWQYEHR